MNRSARWLLPEGIEEILPPESWRLEACHRRLFDLFRCWGYDPIVPPMIEFLESLLTGTGNDLDLQTFKLTDQMTGRMMGVRADMTPQAARIDAHQLKRDVPTRLFYMGTVLRTRDDGFGGSRTPFQVGAELFGHADRSSDIEVIDLMLAMFEASGVSDLYLDLGHVGIFRALAAQAGLEKEQETALFDALQRKAISEIGDLVAEFGISGDVRECFSALAELNGGPEVLDQAHERLLGADAQVLAALENLRAVASGIAKRHPNLPLHFDLAELRGYRYQTGVVFAAFTPQMGREIARGGRYDDIGKVFGRARPATGFSADLRTILRLSRDDFGVGYVRAIFSPADSDPGLLRTIADLRAQGERVIVALAGQPGGALEMGCDRELVNKDGAWQIRSVVHT